MRKTKHNALDENAIYGAPIWKSDGAKGSGFVEDYNRELSPHPSFSCGLTPVSKNVFMSLTIHRDVVRKIEDESDPYKRQRMLCDARHKYL